MLAYVNAQKWSLFLVCNIFFEIWWSLIPNFLLHASICKRSEMIIFFSLKYFFLKSGEVWFGIFCYMLAYVNVQKWLFFLVWNIFSEIWWGLIRNFLVHASICKRSEMIIFFSLKYFFWNLVKSDSEFSVTC